MGVSDPTSPTPAQDKFEAVNRISRLTGSGPQDLGPGSKERRSVLVNLVVGLDLDVDTSLPKPELGAAICAALGAPWGQDCWSAGDTITLVGLNRVLSVAESTLQSGYSNNERRDTGRRSDGLVGSDLHTGNVDVADEMHLREIESMNDAALDDEEYERTSMEAAIAAGLGELSSVDVVPNEVGQPNEFDASAVDFRGNTWLDYVVKVQDWLRLTSTLRGGASVAEVVHELFTDLRAEPAEAVSVVDGRATLTVVGLDALQARVDRAVSLKDKFVENLELNGSISAATATWIEDWEEVVDETISGPIVAKALTWGIADFAARASRGRLELNPSYQRGDVWPLRDSQMLIESILRGIPLPSVIILRPASDDASYEVVDGKQRLTSILRFMGTHPEAVSVVRRADERFPGENLKELFQTDYSKFRRKWKNLTGETLSGGLEKTYYFPFKLGTGSSALDHDLEELQGRYYYEIKAKTVKVGGERVEIREVFENQVEYKIPVIEYTEATRRQIHDVFNLYNKQGKHLNAEEIRNALYHDLDLMRALSVAAGDNEHLDEVASFLGSVGEEVGRIQEMLDEYRFGSARYRRTKVLSWLCSLLFVDSRGDDGATRKLSTAGQINHLLDRVERQPQDPLRQHDTIRSALRLVESAMECHSSLDDVWVPKFKDNGQGVKWQELQLIASLLGVAMVVAVLGDQAEDRLIGCADALNEKSGADKWLRPGKTQTATQWGYIADVSLGILDEVGVHQADVEAELQRRFGFSCVAGLESIRRSAGQ